MSRPAPPVRWSRRALLGVGAGLMLVALAWLLPVNLNWCRPLCWPPPAPEPRR